MSLSERENELVTVVSPELLRPGHVWVPAELRWYRRRVTLALLRNSLGITGQVAQRAVEVRHVTRCRSIKLRPQTMMPMP